ncbi:MAG: hypothetical protein ACLR1R_05000 [Ruminococcus callidus]
MKGGVFCECGSHSFADLVHCGDFRSASDGEAAAGELQPSELVITILISNIATLPLEDTSIP